jgi:uncharacterized membrane-anchored protein YhcB (DUF1043 family)
VIGTVILWAFALWGAYCAAFVGSNAIRFSRGEVRDDDPPLVKENLALQKELNRARRAIDHFRELVSIQSRMLMRFRKLFEAQAIEIGYLEFEAKEELDQLKARTPELRHG